MGRAELQGPNTLVTDPLPTDGLLISSQLTMPLYASAAMRALLTDRALFTRRVMLPGVVSAAAALGAQGGTVSWGAIMATAASKTSTARP